jgi:hypothetical protein
VVLVLGTWGASAAVLALGWLIREAVLAVFTQRGDK